MNAAQALELLTRVKPLLMERYGVVRLALFAEYHRQIVARTTSIPSTAA